MNRFKWCKGGGFDLNELYQLTESWRESRKKEYWGRIDGLAEKGIDVEWAVSWGNMEEVLVGYKHLVQLYFFP